MIGNSSRGKGRRPRRRAATVLLAGLLLAASAPAWGQLGFRIQFGGRRPQETKASVVAVALAKAVQQVQQRFDQGRRALPVQTGPGGEQAYPREKVMELVDVTEKDLDQAIERVGEPGLAALRYWAAEELRRVRSELEISPGARIAAASRGPQAVAVVASLGSYALPASDSPCPCAANGSAAGAHSKELAGAKVSLYPLPGVVQAKTEARQQDTIGAERSNQVLEHVGQMIGRLFFLAANDDLEVDLWVGSTPKQPAAFRFWSQGFGKGSPPAPTIIRTNDKRKRVLRGLYSYRASFGDGPVVEYLSRDASGPAHAGLGDDSERLDLVNGTSFFCCRFDDKYCHHVDSAKDCRPGRP